MKLAIIVPAHHASTTAAWFLICVRDEEPPAGPLVLRHARIVTVEAAREDYGVKVP